MRIGAARRTEEFDESRLLSLSQWRSNLACAYSSMHDLLFLITLFTQSLILVTFVAADPICSSIFGNPSFRDCHLLGLELMNGWPTSSEVQPDRDRRLHLFSLPTADVPSWVSPRAQVQRVDLPRFGWQGVYPLDANIVLFTHVSV